MTDTDRQTDGRRNSQAHNNNCAHESRRVVKKCSIMPWQTDMLLRYSAQFTTIRYKNNERSLLEKHGRLSRQDLQKQNCIQHSHHRTPPRDWCFELSGYVQAAGKWCDLLSTFCVGQALPWYTQWQLKASHTQQGYRYFKKQSSLHITSDKITAVLPSILEMHR